MGDLWTVDSRLGTAETRAIADKLLQRWGCVVSGSGWSHKANGAEKATVQISTQTAIDVPTITTRTKNAGKPRQIADRGIGADIQPIEFYATLSYGHVRSYIPTDTAYLLPASSWARGMRKDGSLPTPKLPPGVRAAADSGGFVAARIWGEYRYSPKQYVAWLNTFNPLWSATMDYCCESPITGGDQRVVADRQFKTTLNAWLFWNEYRGVSWAWVPTIQGWEVADYVRHAREMKPLIMIMAEHYKDNPEWRVGIGTLCNRADSQMVQQVALAVAAELPGIKFHLWGVKLAVMADRLYLPGVVSVDSAAWDRGGLKRDSINAKAERESTGQSQAEYKYAVSLPSYKAKFENAIRQPKQRPLPFGAGESGQVVNQEVEGANEKAQK